MNEPQTKDPMVSFRSTIVGTNKRGDTRYQLYLTQQEAKSLANAILTSNTAPTGVKLDLHIGKRTNSSTGHQFDSAYVFVKTVQETAANVGAPRTFRPVAATTPKVSAIEKMKASTNS